MSMYTRPDKLNIEIPIGTQFENALRNAMHGRTTKVQNKQGNVMDKYEGTDFIYFDMRIDATLNFSEKHFMPFICNTDIEILPGTKLQMGIRHGNTHKNEITGEKYTEFPEPVVVIGCDYANGKAYEDKADDVFAALVRNVEAIENYATDVLADYTEMDKDERDCLFETPLRPNPAYRTPRNIGKRFRELNDFQTTIMASKIQNEQQLE